MYFKLMVGKDNRFFVPWSYKKELHVRTTGFRHEAQVIVLSAHDAATVGHGLPGTLARNPGGLRHYLFAQSSDALPTIAGGGISLRA